MYTFEILVGLTALWLILIAVAAFGSKPFNKRNNVHFVIAMGLMVVVLFGWIVIGLVIPDDKIRQPLHASEYSVVRNGKSLIIQYDDMIHTTSDYYTYTTPDSLLYVEYITEENVYGFDLTKYIEVSVNR